MGLLDFANPGQDKLTPQFLDVLNAVAGNYGGLRITSGYRDPAYNAKVGGAKGSRHTHGDASDIDLSGLSDEQRIALVNDLRGKGAKGFISYSKSPNMLHVDMGIPGVRPNEHFMFDRSAKNMSNAPAWFQQAASGSAGTQGIADDAMAAIGKQPMQRGTQSAIVGSGADTMNTPQQQGLLGQIARPDEKVGGLLGAMFGNMTPDRADQLRANIGGLMGINNQGMVDGARGRMRSRSGARENDLNYAREQQQTEQERQREAQRTAQSQEWIAQNHPDLASAVQSGVLTPQQAYAIANNKPETYRQVSGADLGYTGEKAGQLFNVGPDGKITAIGGGGTSITNNLGGTSTAGWEAIDKRYAETWLSDSTSGLSDVASQAGTIAAVLGDLEAGKELTGPMVGIQGDFARAIMNPDAQDAKDRVESVVQRSLRETLGSQFTAQEGDRLIARSYNPMLPPEQNARRLRALLTTLQSVAQQKMDMRNHFNENGTLQGFNGSLSIPTVDDFIAIMDEASPSAEAPTETGGPKVLRFNEDGTLSDG